MLLHGTTTVEAKSGYGLNLKDEIKQLRILQECDRLHPADVIPTFMGAHEIPLDFKDRKKEYMDFIIQKVLPEVTKNKLAEFFDVFCEKDVYSIADTRTLVRAAQAAGLKVKIHADEFSSLGGAQLAAEVGAISAEHLVNISKEGIEKIAQSATAAILLPGVPFFLMMGKHAPARQLIDQGANVAIASDFNPGSSMTENMLFILQLAVLTMGFSIEEAIQAATANAAYAVSRDGEIGSLEIGKKMDLILCDIPNYYHLVYHLGINPVKHVIKDGRAVVKEGQVLKHKQIYNPSFSL
jgi:imidazolonepropionase